MTEQEVENIGDEIRKLLRRLEVATVGLYVLVIAIVVISFFYLKAQNDQTTAALCTFRANLESQVAQTSSFLKDHPEGFAGIPAATLKTNAANQQRAIDSLSGLDCPPPAPDLSQP